MKLIADLFDKSRPYFEQGGALASLNPLFDAVETVFFSTGITTRMDSHVRDSLDLKRFMSFVMVALIPPCVFGIYNAGYQSNIASGASLSHWAAVSKGLFIFMPLLMVSYGVGLFWEILFASIRKHPVSEGFLVTGLLFPLTLPPTMPLWQAAVGISFGVVIGKEVFGGTGRNILNPALTGRAFLFFAYPANMSGDAVWVVVDKAKTGAVDAFSGATPLSIAGLANAQEKIEAVLRTCRLSLYQAAAGALPGQYRGHVRPFVPCRVRSCLMVVGIASYRIIVGGVLGVLLTGYLLNLVAGDTVFRLVVPQPVLSSGDGRICLWHCLHGHRPGVSPGYGQSQMGIWIFYRHADRADTGVQSGLSRRHHAGDPVYESFFSAAGSYRDQVENQKKGDQCLTMSNQLFLPWQQRSSAACF